MPMAKAKAMEKAGSFIDNSS